MSRRLRWIALLVAVLLVHAMVAWWAQDALVGWGASRQPMPQRLEAAFVRTLEPAEPPSVAAAAPTATPAPAARRRAARARPPQAPASQPAEPPPSAAPDVPAVVAAASQAEPPPTPVVATEPAPPAASAPASAPASGPTATAAAPAASSASAPAFDWPPSTRLTYRLQGNYRGELHGQARVQWVRLGERYQVQLDVVVGPSFAPLLSRSMTSDGELGERGLVPRRYDEATKLPFQSPRRVAVQFAPDSVTLANGSTRVPLPGVQDTASQFVQMTWMFTTQPELLRVGNSIELPLALPRRMDRWTYDVLAEERLYTPVGEVDTFHLKPRRAEARPRGELSAEIWFAPRLQYLPVRIRIQQDAETYVDLMLDAAPLQAEPQPAPR